MNIYENIRELPFFLCVSEKASFSAAARTLNLDPSTISKVIQRLENKLGVRLFHRTSRVLQLTQEGERFLAAAQKIMSALQEAEEALMPQSDEVCGVLRIGCTTAYGRRVLAPLLPGFARKHPGLRVEFVLEPVCSDLLEKQIDLAFQLGPIPDSTLVARRISQARWHICGAPAYLQRAGVPRTPEDLQRHTCLNFLQGSYRSEWRFSSGRPAIPVTPEALVAANDGELLCALAVAGMGLVRLADYHTHEAFRSGELVPVLQDYEDEAEPIYAVYASRKHLSARIRAFLEHVEEGLMERA